MTSHEIIEVVQEHAPSIVGADEPVPWLLVALILFGSAILSWGATEAAKATVLARLKFTEDIDTREARRRMWWSPLLVLVAMAMGAGVGAGVGAIDWSAGYGALVGCCGGALASFLVGLVKGHLGAVVSRVVGSGKDNANPE
jgi:hypothetical protein